MRGRSVFSSRLLLLTLTWPLATGCGSEPRASADIATTQGHPKVDAAECAKTESAVVTMAGVESTDGTSSPPGAASSVVATSQSQVAAVAPGVLPLSTADQDAAILAQTDLADAQRLAAAQRLLILDRKRLVLAYDDRASVAIIRKLIQIGVAAQDTVVLPLVIDLFELRGGEERIDFAAYLLSFGHAAVDRLVALLGSSDTSLVMRAVDALAKMQAVTAADSVASLLHHPDSWVRISAAHGLGKIAAPGAVAALLPALADTSYAVVNAAMVALGRLRAAELYDPAIELVDSDNPHVRKHAAIALGELGDARAESSIRRLAEQDADSGVRFMAKRALQRLLEQQVRREH